MELRRKKQQKLITINERFEMNKGEDLPPEKG